MHDQRYKADIMATSCEDYNWLWDYFTSENNIAKCDICKISLERTRVPKSNLMRHIRNQHRDDYRRIVSSGNSIKDLESQLYIIQNNDISCKFCNFICYAASNFYCIRNHLERAHKIKEDKAAEICEWLRKYYFDEIDTDRNRRCITCNIPILNKPLLLMEHLSKTHKIIFLESKPTGFLTSKNWVWEYFLRSEEQAAKCSVCNQHYFLSKNLSNIRTHIERKHGNIFDVLKNSQVNKYSPYSITERNQVKCDICEKIYDLLFKPSAYMKTHLIDAHNLNEDIARKLCNWVLEYFHISMFQTSKCNICENMFKTSNCFNLMIHLKEAHQLRVSPEIIPARLSSSLSNLFHSDIYAQDVITSSKSQQPIRRFDQSSDCDNFFVQIDESSEIITSRHAQDIVTSSKSQQPTCNFDQSFDCDNFYDQTDESSEIRTTRLLSSSSRLLNSDNNAEDIVASSSYQHPLVIYTDFPN